jgi:uncharacterized protein YdaU (DUF1376 family)
MKAGESMAKAPAFQWYPRDYLTDEAVVRMSLEQQGAYVRLLSHQWLEGSIPADMPGLAALCGTAPARMQKLWPAIAPKFEPVGDGRLCNARLEAARKQKDEWRERQRAGGKRGAEKRWGGEKEGMGTPMGTPMGQPTDNPMGSDSSAVCSLQSAVATTETEGADAPPKPSGKRARQLPTDWQPNDEHRKLAATLMNVRLSVEVQKFRDHFTANGKPMKDWDAAFRNWLRRAQEYAPTKPAPATEAATVREELPRSTAPRQGADPGQERSRRDREEQERVDAWTAANPDEARTMRAQVKSLLDGPMWRDAPETIREATARSEYRKRVLAKLRPVAA